MSTTKPGSQISICSTLRILHERRTPPPPTINNHQPVVSGSKTRLFTSTLFPFRALTTVLAPLLSFPFPSTSYLSAHLSIRGVSAGRGTGGEQTKAAQCVCLCCECVCVFWVPLLSVLFLSSCILPLTPVFLGRVARGNLVCFGIILPPSSERKKLPPNREPGGRRRMDGRKEHVRVAGV
jgi:hypothetical protein